MIVTFNKYQPIVYPIVSNIENYEWELDVGRIGDLIHFKKWIFDVDTLSFKAWIKKMAYPSAIQE